MAIIATIDNTRPASSYVTTHTPPITSLVRRQRQTPRIRRRRLPDMAASRLAASRHAEKPSRRLCRHALVNSFADTPAARPPTHIYRSPVFIDATHRLPALPRIATPAAWSSSD